MSIVAKFPSKRTKVVLRCTAVDVDTVGVGFVEEIATQNFTSSLLSFATSLTLSNVNMRSKLKMGFLSLLIILISPILIALIGY